MYDLFNIDPVSLHFHKNIKSAAIKEAKMHQNVRLKRKVLIYISPYFHIFTYRINGIIKNIR